MSDTPDPTPADVARYAERAGLPVDDATAEAFAEQFAAQDAILADLEALAPDDPPERDSWAPDDESDPLGAFLTRCSVARTDAGPLAGLTVGVKDNVAVAGVPTTCGSPLLADFVPAFDATVVDRLLDAGATVVGKTNMDEFAFGGDASTMRRRLARNPHDPAHQPGSSSAGSGVAAATGAVDLAVGSDTGGSIRFPAAWSGVPGIKPTRGLVSHHGFVQYAKTLDSVGLLAGEVDVLARGLAAVAGPDPADERTRGATVGDYAAAVDAAGDPEGLTIGLASDLFGNAPELDDLARAAVDDLVDAGATVREVSIPDYDLWLPAWLGIATTEVGNYLRAGGTNYWQLADGWPGLTAAFDEAFATSADELGDTILAARLYAAHRTATDRDRAYALAHRARRRLTAGVDAALADVDVLASTTVPLLAPAWGEGVDDVFAALSNTGPFNVSGHPAVSVPCGQVDGLPVGLQFVGAPFDETTILGAAADWASLHDRVRPEGA